MYDLINAFARLSYSQLVRTCLIQFTGRYEPMNLWCQFALVTEEGGLE